MSSTRALAELTERARHELKAMAYPAKSWVEPVRPPSGEHVYDVVIVGAGQSGMACALGLQRDGIPNILVLDRNPAGYEGPWETYARMVELRTPKYSVGMEMGIPSLSARAWYETRYGKEAWARIDRVPRHDWMDYLRWYRAVVEVPIENEVAVESTRPDGALLALETDGPRGRRRLLARKVVHATGFDGCGEWYTPELIAAHLPPERWTHSNVAFDLSRAHGKRVGILGHGAGAFDTASALIAAGAASVDLCYRRARIPTVNPHRWIESAGFLKHYPELADSIRWEIAHHFDTADQPPTQRSFDNATRYPNFRRHPGTPWLDVRMDGDVVRAYAPARDFEFDFVVAATGSIINLQARPELRGLADDIVTWAERYTPPPALAHPHLGRYPYLGLGYEFLEREPGRAPWLASVFSYNFCSYVSQGPHSTSISGHKHSLPRVTRRITRDLFAEQAGGLVADIKAYAEPELVIPAEQLQPIERAATGG